VLSETFYWFVLVGLAAQLVDGALGMAFGLMSSSVLLSMGLPPAAVSASVHSAEVFTTGASGLSHLALGNVDKRLFLRLALPGMAGGMLPGGCANAGCRWRRACWRSGSACTRSAARHRTGWPGGRRNADMPACGRAAWRHVPSPCLRSLRAGAVFIAGSHCSGPCAR